MLQTGGKKERDKVGQSLEGLRKTAMGSHHHGGVPVFTSGSSHLHWIRDITEASFTKLLPGPYILDILICE